MKHRATSFYFRPLNFKKLILKISSQNSIPTKHVKIGQRHSIVNIMEKSNNF